MKPNSHKLVMLTIYPYPHIGGISTVIENYFSWLGVGSTKIISLSNFVPKFFRWFTVSGPAFILNIFIPGLGALWLYFSQVLLFKILLAALNFPKETVFIAHDIPSLNAICTKCSKKILVAHDYYSLSLFSSGSIRAGSIFERFFKTIEAFGYKKADIIITVDNRIKAYVVEFGVPKDKVITILNAPNTKIFKPFDGRKAEFRREFRLPEDYFVILAPRRLVKKTGIEYAIMAMEKICSVYDKCLLVIAGVGPEELRLRKLTDALSLAKKVLFLGGVEPKDMWRLYNACDIVVIPSVSINGVEEATSLSALEAMSCGKPVIASNIGGLREIIKNGENGFLVPEKNPDALASAFVKLIADKELLLRLGSKARRFAVSHEELAKYQLKSLLSGLDR